MDYYFYNLHNLFLILTALFISCGINAANVNTQRYIVYTGSHNGEAEDIETARLTQTNILSTIIPSEETERLSPIYTYNHAFKGFTAMLTVEEASILSGRDEIVSVFPDRELELHTTRSWDYLEAKSGIKSELNISQPIASSDIIVGVIDTGIWPESPSFDDHGFGEIPKKWKGVCMEGPFFNISHCNRKLIGARYYDDDDDSDLTPRDFVGHGTHVASTIGGLPVANANYRGLGKGTVKGGFPSSRIAIYKACRMRRCHDSTVLKAINDAIEDGVDIISISLGLGINHFLQDAIAIGALHANRRGVMVVCSAGNDGPSPYTVSNSAPWIFTIGASSIDREFEANIILGNGDVIQGFAISFSNLSRSDAYPLAFGEDIAVNSTTAIEARSCTSESIDASKIVGKIVICITEFSDLPDKIVQAGGLILVDDTRKAFPVNVDEAVGYSSDYAFSVVGNMTGSQILDYVNTSMNPTATILRSVEVPGFKPAPIIAPFSSRGPEFLTESIIKPDVTAPGVAILASVPPVSANGSEIVLGKSTGFGFMSGTSMACPHVSGASAFIKSIHPNWTPSMIKSALMTTATVANNLDKPISDYTDAFASPHEMGSGEINPARALNPGLVFETSHREYLNFLCHYGYNQTTVRSFSSDPAFVCPLEVSLDFISNINYPSISVSRLESPRTITRTVANVGPANSTYNVKIDSPTGLLVNVSPSTLVFSEESVNASFDVSFDGSGSTKGYKFGSVTWYDGTHSVRVVFSVNIM